MKQDKIEDKLRNALWEKVANEFENFKKEQLYKSKEEIFNNSYEISKLNDFTDMCDPDYGCLNINEVKALLKEKYPIHTLYNFYMKSEDGGISDLYESIYFRLNNLVIANMNKEKER